MKIKFIFSVLISMSSVLFAGDLQKTSGGFPRVYFDQLPAEYAAKNPNYREPVAIRNAPKGCTIVAYSFPVSELEKVFKKKFTRDVVDCRRNLKKVWGVDIPKEGYAIYLKHSSLLIVCTDILNQNLVTAVSLLDKYQ